MQPSETDHTLMPSGSHPGMQTSGHPGMQTSGHPVMQTSSHPGMQTSAHLTKQTSGPLAPRMPGSHGTVRLTAAARQEYDQYMQNRLREQQKQQERVRPMHTIVGVIILISLSN